MQLLEVIKDLISFKTITGNAEQIDACLSYIERLLKPTGAVVEICRHENASPVIFAKNTQTEHFDVLVLGHLDVVPADDKMFEPYLKDGKLYGRGTLDMKSFAAVAVNSMSQVMKENLPLKFGFVLSTDEEEGSKSLEEFLKNHPNLKADIVLDNDVGGDIYKIVTRCKNPVYVKLKAKGSAAHGSTPWEALDANEQLFKTWQNIRKMYPAFDLKTGKPKDVWIDTLHFATIEGGKVSNIISDEATALLDFRLTEKSSVQDLKQKLSGLMEEGVSFEVTYQSIPVVVDEQNPVLLAYKKLAEDVLEKTIEFEYMGGATDARSLYERGATVIMHSGTGKGMHAKGEYVELKSVEQIADIQMKFLLKLAEKK
ncbi:MAG: M20 family metallopeptidase [Alphaproteobacteria bacterium]|nr:M20 family metallopeptidase [Alphaproteobacteria bacterium]